MSLSSFYVIAFTVFGLAVIATAQLGDELGFGNGGDVGFSGLSGSGLIDNQPGVLQQQYNFQPASSVGSFGGFGAGLGISNGLFSGNIGIPSQESITQLGQAIAEGGVPSGVHGEIATPTAQPPPQGEARRVGIAARLLGAGFLNRRRK